MAGFPSPFGNEDGSLFDDYNEFIPKHIPRIRNFLEGHDVLTGDDHIAFHKLTRELFEMNRIRLLRKEYTTYLRIQHE